MSNNVKSPNGKIQSNKDSKSRQTHDNQILGEKSILFFLFWIKSHELN